VKKDKFIVTKNVLLQTFFLFATIYFVNN